jgi:uracil-DNA glycosylase
MLIGGPGAEEDRQECPSAPPGAQQDSAHRHATLPTSLISSSAAAGHRDPEPDEVRACCGYLERQIDS